MNSFRSFANGLAVFLAILVIFYVLTSYVKFSPNDTKLENGESKLTQFFDASQSNKDYFRIAVLLILSALAGILLKKRPEFAVLTSAGVLAYVLTLKTADSLAKRPMVIIIFCACHTVAEIIGAALAEREQKKLYCSNSGLLLGIPALAAAVYSAVMQYRLGIAAEICAELEENFIEPTSKMKFFPDLLQVVKDHMLYNSVEDARTLMFNFNRQLSLTPLKTAILNTVEAEQKQVYIRLAIILFAVTVLGFALRRYSKLIQPALAAVPCLYAVLQLQRNMLSTLTMTVLVFAVSSFICAMASADCSRLPEEDAEADAEELSEEAIETKQPEEETDITTGSGEIYYL